jgi:hypothetical protein
MGAEIAPEFTILLIVTDRVDLWILPEFINKTLNYLNHYVVSFSLVLDLIH